MEWNIKNNPTFKDISENRSSYFLTVRKRSAFVAKDYYNSKHFIYNNNHFKVNLNNFHLLLILAIIND